MVRVELGNGVARQMCANVNVLEKGGRIAEAATACLQMTPTADGPEVSVATAPQDLEPGTRVTPGAGAAITSRSTGQGATYGFVSEAGVYFPVESADDLALLGYTPEQSVTVPATWTQLLEQGPTLSRSIARTTASGQGDD